MHTNETDVIVDFYIINEILAKYLILHDVKHLQYFYRGELYFEFIIISMKKTSSRKGGAQKWQVSAWGHFRKYWKFSTNPKLENLAYS